MSVCSRILTIAFICISFFQSDAQFQFYQFDISSGLSQNSVTKVFKDSEGYYWIGTQDGLNRFDGNVFEVFRHNRKDNKSITDNFVLDISEDRFGQLWIGTRHCINRYNRNTKTFTNVTNKPALGIYGGHNSVAKLAFDRAGNLYFTSIGMLFKIEVEQLKMPMPKIDTVLKLLTGDFSIDENDVIRAVSQGNYYKCQVKEVNEILKHEAFKEQKTTSCTKINLQSIKDKTYVIACNGLFLIDDANKEWKELFAKELIGIGIYSIDVDLAGKLWIATDKGLYVEDDKTKSVHKVHTNLEYPYALKSEHIISLCQTNDSLLWIGSNGHGVFVYDQKASAINFINRYTHPQLISDNFSTTYYSNKKIFAGTNKGIAIFDNQLNLENQMITDDVVSDIAFANDGKIFAATSNGLAILSNKGTLIKRINKANSIFKSNKLFSVLFISDSEVWVGTEMGLYRYSFTTNELKYFKCSLTQHENNLGYILSVNKDYQNRIWVCHNFGISVLKPRLNEYVNYPYAEGKTDSISHRLAVAFFDDNKDEKWIGTLGGGLNFFNESKNKFKSFNINDGLCSDFVTSIVKDIEGDLWIGTSNGISRFDLKSNKFQNYTATDGLIGNEVNWNAMEILPNNKLIVAGPLGLSIINLEKIKSRVKLKIPIVKNLSLDNIEMGTMLDTLVLKSNINKIAISLAYPDFRMRKNIIYEYKMSGLDENYFQLAPHQVAINISNLAYGQYTLCVRVTDNKSSTFSEDKKVIIKIIPPFWRTLWFLFILLIFGIGIILLIIIFFVRKRHKEEIRKIEIEHKVYLERERISRDLHDNIGSQLTYIISNLDFLKFKIQNESKSDTQSVIEELGVYARNTVQQLRDTIWAISGEKISIDEFSHRVKSYLVNFLSLNKNMTFSMEVNGTIDKHLSPAQLLNIFRIIQEAVNNIVKHSEATIIEIYFDATKNDLLVVIKDNGKGISNLNNENYGLKSMDYRAKNIDGILKITSEQNKGTCIELKCPLK